MRSAVFEKLNLKDRREIIVLDFNRDTGSDALGAIGFEAVRQIAIDEDWTALRFRRAEFVKSLARAPQRAMSAEGRAKADRVASAVQCDQNSASARRRKG